ncbi:MAG TPA: ATP-dependent 6-phosphofructokinase [bacterium]|uniref:Pyrophosphate--fructose 6-phosphate 1-phosphotransferase n=1 Tax=candidate division TA06 bacterium ADurb.Bin417 TaxID=1852828 RepID=A0A1V5MJ47_UNCT6|nr:MAG: Pyrophosphate--fructose 6-phosphate 1-phosphotransferase [candidate division TA06 bacterium ADurb.Bin417]HNQ35040.1 ATP-dependent 6-phosphofructokinase [bacterium]HNS48197.1 ATP-dependent 6-phosphofructokinase [bacterium]
MKIGILTGGGDCPGLNPAIRGCVYRALDFGYECVGFLDGWKGPYNAVTIPLGLKEVEPLVDRGGTILGTSRFNPFKKEGAPEQVEANLKKLGIDALVAMGGEDTLGVANKLHQRGVKVVGVPKTMDNDLSATDYTFGFDTSVTRALDACRALLDTGTSHRRIMVLEVMGRHAGWVALYTALGAGADWALLPEFKPDYAAMAAHLKQVFARKKVALVVVSEGTEFSEDGEEPLGEKDAFGHIILKKRNLGEKIADYIEKETGVETRSAVIGHMQRGGPPTLFDRILGLRVGVKAAELVSEGKFGMMAALRGQEVIGVPLAEALANLKVVDKAWLDLARVFFK